MSGATLLGVLFIGHSLFGHANPAMLEQSLQALGHGSRVEAHIINGAPLKYNWDNAADAEGVNARAVLPRGDVDTVILTEAIPLRNHTTWSDTKRYAMSFYGLAQAANPDVRVFVQETWHSLNSGSSIDVPYDENDHIPWRDRLDQDLVVWEDIVAHMNSARPDGSAEVRLIPAGQAMAALYDEIAKGTVPGLTHIGNVFSDDIHPSPLGDYFLTLVQVATLTGAAPDEVPRRLRNQWGGAIPSPSAALAERLKEIAWDAVSNYHAGQLAAVSPGSVPVPQTTEPAQVEVEPAPPPERVAPATSVQAVALPAGRGEMAIGLAALTDWNPAVPFLDVMKTARPWFGHLPNRWGGIEPTDLVAAGVLDADGWPRIMPRSAASLGTVVLTDMPEDAQSLAGRYVLRFDGKGIVEVAGRASGVRYGRNEVSFDYTPGPGSVDIRIQRTAVREGGDYVRNIRLIREDRWTAYEAGARFNPDWIARLKGFDTLRFMDWMGTNNSEQSAWNDRPQVTDATFAQGNMPLEVMIALANETGSDAWFNIPHMADDAYIRAFAEQVKATLDPNLKAYVELSNEVWNWQFTQAAWSDAQAKAEWDVNDKWMQHYGMRSAQMADIWRDVYAEEADARLVLVISSQTGWLGLESEALEAPLWQADGHPAPATLFDAYAVTGYFGGILGTEGRAGQVRDWLDQSLARAEQAASGLQGEARRRQIEQTRFDHASALAGQELDDGGVSGDISDTVSDLISRVLPYHAQVAARHDLDLIMYEGGTHLVGIGPVVDDAALTAFFQHFNYTDEMGQLYTKLLAGWTALGGQMFNAYSDVYTPTKWGSWGALRHLDDRNPRWDALVAAQ